MHACMLYLVLCDNLRQQNAVPYNVCVGRDLDLDFEIPFRELGFMGVPHRTTAFIMPTVNCLVELIEMPFTVVTMSEVNIVNLERVGFNLRNFDMTLVFKDLTRDVLRIDAIPTKSLDTIREWLSSIGIKYYEGKMNLNWKPILKSIMEDPEQFIADGGWNFLDAEGGEDDEGEEDEEEEDQEFAPDSSEGVCTVFWPVVSKVPDASFGPKFNTAIVNRRRVQMMPAVMTESLEEEGDDSDEDASEDEEEEEACLGMNWKRKPSMLCDNLRQQNAVPYNVCVGRDLDLDFEIPFRELGFMGVPHRTTAFIMPTVNCLVELIEMPFTVVTMSEVNIVNLERVGFNLRNFDMTLVFKDLTRDVLRIDAIPTKSLDTIREWLSSIGIKYYEGKMNLNWKPILKSIMEDPEQFIADGGWNFLDAEGGEDDEGEEDEEEEDQEFAPDSSEGEESSDDASSDDESLEEEGDDSDEDASEDEEEEEGMSWDELEEEAIKEDRRKNQEEAESDEEAAGKRKKKGGAAGGRPVKRGRH
eukprot:jgi/Botrbrau1/17830/Bobra.0127s0074.1